MKVLFHKSTSSQFTEHLLESVLSIVAQKQVTVTSSIGAFIEALIRYRIEVPIVVVQVSGLRDIKRINQLSDLLDGLYLILATQSSQKALLTSCRNLYPRLLIQNKGDIALVTSVIEKRIAVHRIHERIEQGKFK